MTDADAILVRILSHQDALRLPVRDWTGHTNANRYFGLQAPGVPFRMNSRTDGARKAGERQLADLQSAGLLTLHRGPRVKFPLVALTPEGDARARAVAGLPGREHGRLFLAAVVEKAQRYVETISGRWCPEIDLNDGRGWGADATQHDRDGLALVELSYLPAAAAGWVCAGSTSLGHAAYVPTGAGIAELRERGKAPALGKPPKSEPAAVDLYRRECDAKLRELWSQKPADSREIGPLPLIPGLLLCTDADLDPDPPITPDGA